MIDYSADLLGLYKLADSFYQTKFENDIYLQIKEQLQTCFNCYLRPTNFIHPAGNADAPIAINSHFVQGLIIKLEANPKKRIVMERLLEIPPGKTICYGEFTALCGFNNAIRNTATLIGQNILPIIVPCHRVVRKDKIGNYIFGTDAKRALLEAEGLVFDFIGKK